MIQIKKTILTLVALLLTAVTGAWAQTPELLVTIESNGNGFSSQTFDGKAILTFGGGQVMNDNDNWGWYNFLGGEEISLTVTGADGYTVTSCTFYTKSSSKTVEGEHPTVYVTGSPSQTYTATGKGGNSLGELGVTKIEVYGYQSASTGPEVAWDKAKKTGTFTMPGGNVTLEPEYYPQAALTAAPTAINDVAATTDGAIVKAGTVAMIGQTENAQGTLMYYAVQSETAPDAPDYDNQNWSDKEPTAADFNQGNVYVWYYVKGNDGDAESTFNDGAITKLGETGYVTLAAPPTYDVTFAEGVNPEPPAEPEWTASPNADVKKGETVTVTYSGPRKVMGVKAEKKGGLPVINGKFSVSDTKQVYFSKGNLRYVSGAWSFFDNQYDYYATYSADAWDKFGWSNSTNNFGMSTSTNNNDYKNDLVDWGTVPGIGSGWRILTLAEWQYLFSTRSASTVNSVANARYAKGKVNNVYGIILFPDTYTHPDGVTNPVGINDTGNTGWNGNNYNATDWGKMEAAGCVFLPAAGYRQGTSVQSAGSSCSYRSSTRYSATLVQYIYFESSLLNLETHNNGYFGQCVRLVQDVK